jgi:4-amino-4-deoxy-L-arabinose transferase-like glycosyltransferase
MESRLSGCREWIVILFAAVVYLIGVISPPSLMDDVDASQALMARNMLLSRDWVSVRLDGVLYLDKAPLKSWMTAGFYALFGAHDWVARLPIALSAIALCWVVFRFGRWAFSSQVGYHAGLFLSTCVGLFLFTRIVLPDVVLTLAVTLSIWGFLRAMDEDEQHPRRWAYVAAASLAAGLLLKSLIGLVFPLGAAFLYLLFTRRLYDRKTWGRLYPFSSFLLFVAIAAPWHVLAIIRNPPYFSFTIHSGPGEYQGFFWLYFINEQLLRFLNLRFPRDYNTVPRFYFWLLNLGWLFPWSVYLPQLRRLSFRPVDRAGRTRLMLLCWISFVMVFFTFSTTQEYYSMPIYPALALLLACGVAASESSIRVGARVVAVTAGCAALAIFGILVIVRGMPTPGVISTALTQNAVDSYTLALGHMSDLTFRAFAYLRLPLVIAGIAFVIGAVGVWRLRGERALLAMALMMVFFFQAARLALVVFDPYLSSRPIAETLKRAPQGKLIIYGDHNDISSLMFYSADNALILNGRKISLEYGSNAPGAPPVFITNDDFGRLWAQPERFYLALHDENIPLILPIVPRERMHLIAAVGGKSLFSNQEVTTSRIKPHPQRTLNSSQ